MATTCCAISIWSHHAALSFITFTICTVFMTSKCLASQTLCCIVTHMYSFSFCSGFNPFELFPRVEQCLILLNIEFRVLKSLLCLVHRFSLELQFYSILFHTLPLFQVLYCLMKRWRFDLVQKVVHKSLHADLTHIPELLVKHLFSLNLGVSEHSRVVKRVEFFSLGVCEYICERCAFL